MIDKIKENSSIEINIIYDFITSLARIANNEEIKEIKEEYAIKRNNDIEKWVINVIKSFEKEQNEKLTLFFRGDNPAGIGLVGHIYKLTDNKEGLNIEDYINNLREVRPVNLLFYLLQSGYSGEKRLTSQLVKRWLSSSNLYDIIDKNYELISDRKWNIFRMMSKPEESKEEIIYLLQYYYNNFYRDEEKEVIQFLKNYCQKNGELIKETARKFIENLFSPEKEQIKSSNKFKIIPIYFGEIMSITDLEKKYCILGYNYYKFVDKAFNDINGIEEQAHIFKALGDKTRLNILQELLNGPKYMTELGEKLEVSTPTINYHIKKFFNAGLVQIDKAENRIYYKLRKDKLQDVIKVMQEKYNL